MREKGWWQCFAAEKVTVGPGELPYRPVVDRTTMTAAMQLSEASTAAIAVLRVMSVGLGVSMRSSSYS